jgi:hypothetical protein
MPRIKHALDRHVILSEKCILEHKLEDVTIQPTKNQLVNIDFDIIDKFEYKMMEK